MSVTADDPVQAARVAVEKALKEERATVKKTLAATERMEKEAAKEDLRASNALWKLSQKNGLDNEPDAKEKEAEKVADRTHAKWSGIARSVARYKKRLAELDDPAELERLVQDELKKQAGLADLRQRKEDGTMATATAPRKRSTSNGVARTVDIPKPLGERVKKELEKGTPVRDLMAKLTKDKTPNPFKGPWSPRAVRTTYKRFTGKKNIPAAAKKSGRVPLAERTPARTTKLANKKTGSARPLSRKAQASGTSRGGTGHRKSKTAGSKKKTAARKRTK